MGVFFLILFIFISILIVGLVLLQEGKGGGLTGMSTGMDGVMGAKNPLRRMTAWLFVFFVILAISINVYFHWRENRDTQIHEGIELPAATVVQETAPAMGPVVVAEDNAAAAPAAPQQTAETVPAPTVDVTVDAETAQPASPSQAAPAPTAEVTIDAETAQPASSGESAQPAPVEIEVQAENK